MADVDPIAARRHAVLLAAGLRWQRRAGVREAAAALSASGGGTVETPLRQARFEARRQRFAQAAALRAEGRLPLFLERKIGPTLDWLDTAPSEAARKAGRPAARIVSSVDPAIQATGFASGFMAAPGLLLTNWHVFPDVASAREAGANFGYEEGERGLLLGTTFALRPDRFFLSHEALDFALVAVEEQAAGGAALADQGWLVPNEAAAKILVGQPVEIIQYPDGGAKRYATRDNRLTDILDEGFLHYRTDTLEGSSGSPVFSEAWELVGLHRGGVPEVKDGRIMTRDGQPWSDDMPDGEINWVANEGIRMSAIIRALAQMPPADPAQAGMLRTLLAATADPADEIARLPAPAARPAAPESIAPPIAATVPGGGLAVTFTGPVTINVQLAAPAPAGAPAGADAPEVAPEKSLRFDPDYAGRPGYDPVFLGPGLAVPVPGIAPERVGEMWPEGAAPTLLAYHHYSLAMNRVRRLAMWTAANVDYAPERRGGGRASFGADRWVYDPRVPAAFQLGERDVYGPAGQVDRGHVVRRQDNAWGATDEEREHANADTFHWTNCTPQHAAFNRAAPPGRYGGVEGPWGGFETYVQSELQRGDSRACILAGPVLAADDPVLDLGGGPVRIPLAFWKVVVVADRGESEATLAAYGFVLDQGDLVRRFGIEFSPGRFARAARPLVDIAALAGLVFDPALIAADRATAFVDVAPTA